MLRPNMMRFKIARNPLSSPNYAYLGTNSGAWQSDKKWKNSSISLAFATQSRAVLKTLHIVHTHSNASGKHEGEKTPQ